jgi:LmbE family N-acetylglucosaminyl deacetylase
MGVAPLDPAGLERYDSLFVAPHGDDVALACPGRLLGEAERGRRALVLALFEPVGAETAAARVLRDLGADYAAAGLGSGAGEALGEDVGREAARLLSLVGPRTQAVHVYAPLGLGHSPEHLLAYETAVRAFATEAGRNLFLYEERPEAFVPGAVRTRLALLGARLPPGAARAAERVGTLRHILRVGEPARLRGLRRGLGARLRALVEARRRLRDARRWNPLRAFGPRLQPVVHVGDEAAQARSRAASEALLPRDAKGRPRGAARFDARALAAAKRLGGVYHAERLWLFLPSGDGLPEVQHPLDLGEI